MDQTLYEFTYLLKPDLNEEEVSLWQRRMSDMIAGFHGTIVTEQSAERRKLTYPIKNHAFAISRYMTLTVAPEYAPKILDELTHEPAILRMFLIKTAKEKKVKKARRVPPAKQGQAAASAPLSPAAAEETAASLPEIRPRTEADAKEPITESRVSLEEIEKHLKKILGGN